MYKEFQRKRHLEKRKVPRPLPKVSFVEPEVTKDYSEKKNLEYLTEFQMYLKYKNIILNTTWDGLLFSTCVDDRTNQ